jgi:DNA-binding transcriptional regulator YiaG
MEYKEFKNILKKNKLTVKKFSQLANISYNTCNTWSKDNRSVPNWVQAFLNLYERNKILEESTDNNCGEYKALAKALQDVINKEK